MAFAQPPGGSVAAGEEGDAQITLQAAHAELSDLVTAWDTPPDVLPEQASPVRAPGHVAARVQLACVGK